ncbi:MAG: transcription termination/antitermination factor NusG [Clostridia bacterium]|nr:transcription termination/antitermination factor NusG [Clostridia bacterium]MBO7156200.1 transcription termination/antitermination factor NusG [Clostridia bacterium]
MSNNENIKWYVIRTYSAYEAFVQKNIEKMVENHNLQDFIFNVSIPTEQVIVEKNGKRKVVERKKFPGYVYIKMIYTDQLGYLIRTIRGASGFVGPEGKPLPLTIEEVKRIGLEKIYEADFHVEVGDNVRIVSGPLETFLATVEEIYPDKEKVKVVVQMFGRQTPVELEYSQIEKINN